MQDIEKRNMTELNLQKVYLERIKKSKYEKARVVINQLKFIVKKKRANEAESERLQALKEVEALEKEVEKELSKKKELELVVV